MPTSAKNIGPFTLGEGDDAVLLVHGFTASPAQFYPMGEYIAAQGYFVRGICLPGHGTNVSDMGRVNWEDWLSAARTAAVDLHKMYKHVYVVGLSMGGLLALLLGEEQKVDAVVTLAAAIRFREEFSSRLSYILSPFYKLRPYGAPCAQVGFCHEYDFGYDGTPLGSVKDLRKLRALAEKGLPALSCPILIVQSKADESVPPIAADVIASGVSSTKKECMMLENEPHVLTLCAKRENIFAKTVAFLKSVQ